MMAFGLRSMADVDDPTGIQTDLDRQWVKLGEADIAHRDRAAISRFVAWRRDIDGVSRNTRRIDLCNLRNAAVRSDVALTDMGLEDVERLFQRLVRPRERNGYGMEPGGTGLYNYQRVLRLFFRYMTERESFGDYPFHNAIEMEDIELGGAGDRDEMLTGDDIEALKDAANNPRDRALIALLADLAGRIGLVLSFRVGDAHLDGPEPYLEPNDTMQDGLKGFESEAIPVLHSRGELRTFVRRHHPDGDTDAAPLFPVVHGYDYDDPQGSAVSDSRIYEVLQDCADRAGLEKAANPHNFRRTGATRLVNSDRLTPSEIQQITGWSDRTLMEMIDVYDYGDATERASAIHQEMGFSDGSTAEGEALEALSLRSLPCGTCGEAIPEAADACPTCGAPADADVKRRRAKVRDRLDDLAIEGDRDDREFAVLGRQRLDSDPAFADELAERLDVQ